MCIVRPGGVSSGRRSCWQSSPKTPKNVVRVWWMSDSARFARTTHKHDQNGHIARCGFSCRPEATAWSEHFEKERPKYPMLSVIGPPCSGKTEYAWSLLQAPLELKIGVLSHFPDRTLADRSDSRLSLCVSFKKPWCCTDCHLATATFDAVPKKIKRSGRTSRNGLGEISGRGSATPARALPVQLVFAEFDSGAKRQGQAGTLLARKKETSSNRHAPTRPCLNQTGASGA